MVFHTEVTILDILSVSSKSHYLQSNLSNHIFCEHQINLRLFSSVSFNLVINDFILDTEMPTTSQIDCATGELPEDKTLSNSEISTKRYFVLLF